MIKSWVLLFALSSLAYAQIPHSTRVWLMTEENHSYQSVIGNANMPSLQLSGEKVCPRDRVLCGAAQFSSRSDAASRWPTGHEQQR